MAHCREKLAFGLSGGICRHESNFELVRAVRDLALVVPETATHDALLAALRADPGALVQSATLFDVYRPKNGAALTEDAPVRAGEKSLAVRLVFNKDDATLTEEEIDAAVSAVLAATHERLGARLRA